MNMNHNLIIITDHNWVIKNTSLIAGIDWPTFMKRVTLYAYEDEISNNNMTGYISSQEEENDKKRDSDITG